MSIGSAAVLVVGGVAIYYTRSHASASIPASDLYTVGYGSVAQTISTSGTLQANQQVNLSFLENGTIKSVNVKVGQTVKAGQVLATLDDSAIKPQLVSAEAALSSAEANLQKVENPATPQAIAAAQDTTPSLTAAPRVDCCLLDEVLRELGE
ncbi:MAG: biotin/lipoyl-binding protein [Firmicutes bacterium]|nr:biotin/lipoyl-binding protein [Bacillota bacterium]